jgi:hypothetical protein
MVPAPFLLFETEWQAIASQPPQGEILIILPYQANQQRIARFVASQLRGKGKRLRVMERQLHTNAL